MAAPRTHVILLGDSTLDNVVWLHEDRDQRVSQQLRRALDAEAVVTDLAADGFTSSDVLRGHEPAISRSTRAAVGEPFPVDVDGVFAPLDALAAVVARTPATHVVLSVGGNDVREILGALHELPATVARFHANFAAILARVIEITSSAAHVIIQLQYRPSLDMDRHYGVYAAIDRLPAEALGLDDAASATPLLKLHALMERLYLPVVAHARAQGLTVLDMPRTLDPRDSRLYVSQIEPSALGGRLIAQLIAHAVQTAATPAEGRVATARVLSAVWDRTNATTDADALEIRTEALPDMWRVLDER